MRACGRARLQDADVSSHSERQSHYETRHACVNTAVVPLRATALSGGIAFAVETGEGTRAGLRKRRHTGVEQPAKEGAA
jgi:hypothetical protein